MYFLTIVIALGAGFITVNYFLTLFEKPKVDGIPDDCRKTNTMHTWYYGEDTYLRCKICNRKPFDD